MAKILLLLASARLLITGTKATLVSQPFSSNEEVAKLTTPDLISKYGYPCEKHSVQTNDSYILEMHRIPHGLKSSAAPKKPIVFLQHGLLGSSANWVVMGPEKGVAYILADEGFDVWMGNSRGNTYSRKHAVYNPEGRSFWDFSWHEMGVYDIPAEIDYILDLVDQPNLFYIGHSQGTTQFYVMASERPEYNAKIRAMFSLAPVAFMNHLTNPLVRTLAQFYRSTGSAIEVMAPFEIFPNSHRLHNFSQWLCKNHGFAQKMICQNAIFLVAGFDENQLNSSMLPVIASHSPAGSSSKQVIHYIQGIINGHFRQYDYSATIGNLKKYGSDLPPLYDLQKISCPVSLHYSENDPLSSPIDVDRLFKELQNPIGKVLVPYKLFNHIDFLWAIDAKPLLYKNIICTMRELSSVGV